MDNICVGDVVTITRGTRYPPRNSETIGIVIDELTTSSDWPMFLVMWDGHIDGLPARRLKKIKKLEQKSSMPVQKEDVTR